MHLIDYPNLVLGALRHAIAGVLKQTAEGGLPGEHHFYITFRTDARGVEIPDSLRREHPDELTIVLQNQFWDLAADDSGFSVTLRFGGVPTHVRVPYDAMTAFADPSVEFGVQLAAPDATIEDTPGAEESGGADAADSGPGDSGTGDSSTGDSSTGDSGTGDSGTVIAFDRNRKRD